ncbi:hypothetical protein ABFY55_19965 [Bacillus altitudinis]
MRIESVDLNISILTKEEERHLLDDWSGPYLNVPTDQTVHALIEAKSQEVPDQKAVTFCGTSWTYEN